MSDEELGAWRKLDSREIHRTPFLTLREDRVITPHGQRSTYCVVDCGHCVGVLPFVDEHSVLMVRQHRYIDQRFTWEMPTGGVHPGEEINEAAQRELAEEAGVHAGQLRRLCSFRTSKSSIDELAHLFVGEDLRPHSVPPDDDESLRWERLPFLDVLGRVLSGEITDGMTVIAVLRVARERGL